LVFFFVREEKSSAKKNKTNKETAKKNNKKWSLHTQNKIKQKQQKRTINECLRHWLRTWRFSFVFFCFFLFLQ